ncbi:YbaB/EbfC family nucleoid-associated protein [Lentzea tibetensis]|uniref:YbaB/EbfC family nucleoid-associated protein n=1 Tax=Lentzea tibetensis TaxID=2591470 RepID=A0A563EI36_9PSEU|nr:YbaB/EbfC family nucleoid-associated protein [Lentzea tibetensis]TWP46354.1 YbaB/EbfC family nucleoid-associated protein [Lentzea tibetensis]
MSDPRVEAVEEAGRKAEQRLAGYQNMKEEMAQLRAAASSPDRAVTVVAGPGGSILNVEFRPEAMRLSPQALGRSVMTTLQLAVAQSARQSAEIVQRFTGDQIDIAARVNKVQEEIFGPAPELPPPPPPQANGSFLQQARSQHPQHPPQAPPRMQPPPPPPAPRPQRPGPPPRVDDDDEGFGSILR